MKTVINILTILGAIMVHGCKQEVNEPYSIFVEEDLKVYVDLPKQCQHSEIHGEGFGPYGLKYSCPFNGKEYEIIIGKVHPEIRYHENMFQQISEESKKYHIEDLMKKDTTVSDFEFGANYDLHTYDNGSYRSIYYEKMIRIPQTDRLLSLSIRKRTGKQQMHDDIDKIKKIGESFKFEETDVK